MSTKFLFYDEVVLFIKQNPFPFICYESGQQILTSLEVHIFVWMQLPCMLLVMLKSEVNFSSVLNSFTVNVNISGNFSHGYHVISLHSAYYLLVIFRSVYGGFSSSTWLVTDMTQHLKSFYGFSDSLFWNIIQMNYFILSFSTLKKVYNMVVIHPVKEI